jgi:hypothetical protein
MGDEVLKRIIILITVLLSCDLLFAQESSMKEEIEVYDSLFNAINKKRFGLEHEIFTSVKNPFISSSKTTIESDVEIQKTKITYSLYGIIENRAKINNTWLTKGDMIDDLRLVKITEQSVTLANTQRVLTLMLSQKGAHNVIIDSK